MTPQLTGLIIGGIIPAFLFAFANLFIKSGVNLGIGIGPYLLSAGAAVMLIGIVISVLSPAFDLPAKAGGYAFSSGLTWGIGVAFVSIAIARYETPMSILVPIFNTNTLIAVILALWIFSEWKQVHALRLIAGALLIVAGSAFVARA